MIISIQFFADDFDFVVLQLIAASGDAVTNVGKNIALSAKLLPAEKPVGVFKYFGSSSHSGPGPEGMTNEASVPCI